VWESKQKVWFDYVNGWGESVGGVEHGDVAFSIVNELGQNGVHRARFLEELVELVPRDIARFGRRLKDIIEPKDGGDGRLKMEFEDGSWAEADMIVGCDGIKSFVRRWMVGAEHPAANPSFTGKYAYRGLIPMDKAIEAVGKEQAENACMHVSRFHHPDTHH